MKIFKSIPILLLVLFITKAKAQDDIPTLSGKVTISIKEGTFDCDVTLSNIPPLKDYFLR